jgi:hypothetical protein
MKTLVLACAFLLVPPLAREVTLAYAPEAGATLHRTFDASAKLSLEEVAWLLDGEEQRTMDEVEQRTEFQEHIVVTDHLGEIEHGRPQDLVRTFDELEQQNTTESGDRAETSEETSSLVGKSVRFAWSADDEAYEATAAPGSEVPHEVLSRLVEDMDLRALLPDGDVEKGDEWEIPVMAYLAWMWPGGHLAFHVEGEELDLGAQDFYDQVVENLEGSGRARFLEVREEEGHEVAVLRVEFEIETSYETTLEADDEHGIPESKLQNEIQRKVEGEVLWDLGLGHARSAALDANVTLIRSRTVEVEDEEGGTHSLEERYTLEGTYEYRTSIEREE